MEIFPSLPFLSFLFSFLLFISFPYLTFFRPSRPSFILSFQSFPSLILFSSFLFLLSSSDGVHIPSRILKQNGVQIIAVGVGRYFNIQQLNTMASHPAKKNVFTGDFSKIHYVTNELARQICNGRQQLSQTKTWNFWKLIHCNVLIYFVIDFSR